MNIYLVRHTTPQIEDGICYGSSDLGLVATFPEEAQRIREVIPADIATVYSSPLQRCARLAEVLSVHAATLDERLREIHFGEWEMQPWDDIPESDRRYFFDDFANRQPPGGESFTQVQTRGLAAFDDYVLRHRDEVDEMLVVAHAGVIRSLLAHWQDRPLMEAYDNDLDYGAVTLLKLEGDRIIPEWVNR